jgi:2-succinyl-5-enolpyruvyl-6-hydroxy-3-cyclohexene-1-carboxylate synthase
MIPAILQAQQVLLGLKQYGIQHIVISPGSRNAPLTIGCSHDRYFTCYSIVDERCAAHYAMGIAQQLGKPTAVLCTSGSALLNYYPAVTEAFYSEIPLIVLSADRPPHKIDIGDGQTIRQSGIYKNHILNEKQLLLVDDVDHTDAIHTNEQRIKEVLNDCISKNGPVHINIPFEEPLYNTVKEYQISFSAPEKYVVTNYEVPYEFLKEWKSATKKMVLLGTMAPHELNLDIIDELVKDPSVIILSEASSNIVHDEVIWGIDTLLAPLEHSGGLDAINPDVVVTIGGMIVSKKVKQFLRKANITAHYHIGERRANDTFFCLKGHLNMPLSDWWKQTREWISLPSSYKETVSKIFALHLEKRVTYLEQLPWSDFKAFDLIFKSLPAPLQLQIGNSSSIRYVQLFKMNPHHFIFANRGTSGIDGCTSTAVGAAVASTIPTILITGDISFFYDSNGLWNKYIPKNFKIILINNNGGGIFRILPGEKDTPEFDTYFETMHQLDAKHLCKLHGLGYHKVEEEHAFAKTFTTFLQENSCAQVLEVVTPRRLNDTVLLNFFKYLK